MIYICLAIGLLICITLSAFFSGSEIVYASVNKLKLKRAANNGDKKAKHALAAIESYAETISTILIGNNLVNIAASSMATVMAIKLWGNVNGPIYATLLMTMIILTFGEILPKTLALPHSYMLSKLFTPILDVFKFIFKPIVKVVTIMVNKLSVLWTPKETEHTTDEELITMVDSIEQEGVIDKKQSELIRSAIQFCDVEAYEIMTPRVDVQAFDIDDDIEKLFENQSIYNHARIPVYEDNIDNIIGVLNGKFLLRKRLIGEVITKQDIKRMLIEPLYVFKTKEASALLQEFKKNKTHMAIVTDEFGGTMGIITMEDILEEIVGDIWDETDEIEEEYIEQSNGEYVVDGDMNIYDFFELVGYDDKDFDSDYSTVGGWVTEILERFPIVDDTFTFDNLIVSVYDVEPHRVLSVKVKIIQKDEIL
ncbi:MAG: hemolysin family protein [Clostridia bacterium]